MRWCGDADATIVCLGDGPESYRSSGEVEGELFELLWFIQERVQNLMASLPGNNEPVWDLLLQLKP